MIQFPHYCPSQVLSDEETRQRYDHTGQTDAEGPQFQGHPHQRGFTVFPDGKWVFQFNFGGWGHTGSRKDSITTHYFLNTVVPESKGRVFLLNFYSDFCMQCEDVERVWEELREVCFMEHKNIVNKFITLVCFPPLYLSFSPSLSFLPSSLLSLPPSLSLSLSLALSFSLSLSLSHSLTLSLTHTRTF